MPYETLDEIHLRLANTVVKYKDKLVYVHDDFEERGDGFYFSISSNAREQPYKVKFDEAFDLSPLQPRYVVVQEKPYWCYRLANRMYQQGANQKNTVLKPVGKTNAYPQGGYNLIGAYNTPLPTQVASPEVCEKLRKSYDDFGIPGSLALNRHLAIWYGVNVDVLGYFVEYKGLSLGGLSLEGGKIVLKADNESISFNPWLREKLDMAGISY